MPSIHVPSEQCNTLQSIPDDTNEYMHPDFGDTLQVAEEYFQHFRDDAEFVFRLVAEEFFKDGPFHGITAADIASGYPLCVSRVIDAASYLESRGLLAVERDTPQDGDCECHACQGKRAYLQMPFSFAADRSILIQRKQREATLAQAEASRIVNSRRPDHSSGYVYLLKCGPRYKIGITKDIQRRISELTKQQPFPLELVHCAIGKDHSAKERELHERYSDVRQHGEWFDLTTDQVAEVIESMNDWAGQSREG